MGVQGLWQLLQAAGKPVSLESLEGKILAVDVSIWLHQAAKGMRDKDGNPLPNAHLQSLFSRVCKLLFYKIKPVFVFDGGVPILKKQTLAARRERRAEAEQEGDKATKKLLHNLIRSEAIKHALGQPTEGSTNSGLAAVRSSGRGRDLFELPPLPEMDRETTGGLNYDDGDDVDPWEERQLHQRIVEEEFQSLDSIDVESDDFRSLPSEIKHEILTEMKEMRKRRRLGKRVPLPENSDDFSSYQMKKLVNQSRLTNHIESVRREMNAQTSADFSQAVGSEYLAGEFESRRVVSEDASHYILIKGLSKQRQVEQASRCEDVVTNVDADAVANVVTEEEKKMLEEPDELLIDSDKEKNYNSKAAENSRENDCCINIGPDIFENDKGAGSKDVVSVGSSSESDDVKITKVEKDVTDDSKRDSVAGSEVVIIEDGSGEPGHVDKGHSMKRKVETEEGEVEKTKMSKLAADVKVTDVSARSEPEDKPQTQQESDSDDDEGFIEITIDPAAAADDDLFPSDMFHTTTPTSNTEPAASHVLDTVTESTGSTDKIPVTVSTENIPNKKTPEQLDADKVATEDVKSQVYHEFNIGDYQLDVSETEAEVAPLVTRKPALSHTDHLKSSRESAVDLEDMQDELENESETLRAERGRQERLATSISDQMNVEAQELLELFGIPYVVSPMEAEAQCAKLDMLGLTHGTITDDSDVWLFGGSRVYKHFFNQKKSVEFYNFSGIQAKFGLDREQLILLAYLCGSDYTEGFQGVGPVTALEILGEFPGHNIDGLLALKAWWDESRQQDKKPMTTKVRTKIREMEFNEGFPNPAVMEAYLNPTVDESAETFSWGSPDLDLLRDYARERLGWNKDKADDLVLPVLKQLNKKETQAKINSFFQPEYFMESKQTVSKRVKQALKKVRGAYHNETPQITTNEDRIQRAKEILGMPKGRGKGRGRGRGRGKVRGQRPEIKVKNEVALSESSSSDEGGFFHEEPEEVEEKPRKGGDGVKRGKGKGRGKNRKLDGDFDSVGHIGKVPLRDQSVPTAKK
ncbi:LOW QUALITY PROTEIN: DNA excision repair protein ERCC-5 homolog [Haliotis rubra]|uniref:LOW QUALITY PROTEIN: DNA excision repair protein ERCC-5 homolog n=1 Tax=Haliotis rubra TaxID=36100 RepID=UPI001EE54325|nr:LOW QUALITY PROTEIN: DNA excision repair protein ERCC-5 homolog [Haliotis rubra]